MMLVSRTRRQATTRPATEVQEQQANTRGKGGGVSPWSTRIQGGRDGENTGEKQKESADGGKIAGSVEE